MDRNSETNIIEKLKKIQTLYESSTFEGEKNAAQEVIYKIKEKLEEERLNKSPEEYQFSIRDIWSRKLFIALLRKYRIKPYRYSRQHSTTVMAKVSEKFVDEVLWKEYEELETELLIYLDEITEKIISKSVNNDTSDLNIIKSLNK